MLDEQPGGEGALRRMLDERAVERVLVNYCRLLDDRHVDVLIELFTDDAEVQFWGQHLRGKEAIASAFGGAAGDPTGRPTSAHVLSNVLVDVEGDTARATSDFTVVSRAGDGAYGVLVCGRFVDELVRSAGGSWRIRSRHTHALARG
jgi:ketosteroid isomerase-like protein